MVFVPINPLKAKNVISQDVFDKPSLLSTITGPVSDKFRIITLIYTGQHHLKQGGFFYCVAESENGMSVYMCFYTVSKLKYH